MNCSRNYNVRQQKKGDSLYEKEMDGSGVSGSDVYGKRDGGFCGVIDPVNRRDELYGIFECI